MFIKSGILEERDYNISKCFQNSLHHRQFNKQFNKCNFIVEIYYICIYVIANETA